LTVLEILVALLLLVGSAVVLTTLWQFDQLAAPPAAPERQSQTPRGAQRHAA
jgi:hypothetical protein